MMKYAFSVSHAQQYPANEAGDGAVNHHVLPAVMSAWGCEVLH